MTGVGFRDLLVERFARQAGFEVETSVNAVAALSDLSKLDPDVALVDLQMPDIGGLDVLKAIRAADPECQVILMTGKAVPISVLRDAGKLAVAARTSAAG